MVVGIRLVAGGLLIAHGLVHLLYLARDVPEFSLEGSWAVPADASRPVAGLLMAATVVGFALLGLAVWGVPWLSGVWPALAMAGAAASLVLLLLFWDVHLLFGVALDLALVAVAVLDPAWMEHIG